jgi:chromosome segregation ATPase
MKNLLVMIGAGVGLFVATVVGLLGAQGRLSWEGTKGIPLLHGLFEPPADHRPEANDGHTAGEDQAAPKPGVPADGLGKEERRDYRIGPAVGPIATAEPKKLEPAAAETGGEPAASANHGDNSHTATASSAAAEPTTADGEFRAKTESVLGQGQYTRGRLFDFPRIQARLSVQDINRILEQTQAEKAAAERERAVLDKRRAELDAREADLRDREQRILEQIRGIEQSRTQLNERIEAFQAQVVLIDKQQATDMAADAATLAAFEPQRAAALLLEWWKRTPADQAKVVRLLTVMETEAANAILETMEVTQAREILDQRAKVIRTDQAPKR